MNPSLRKIGVLSGLFSTSLLVGDLAFVTDFDATIYSFDTNDVSTPATAYTAPTIVDNIAFSPDGATVYFTTDFGGDVYSFPTNNPSMITKLNTTIPNPMGIAISSDGTLGFVGQDFGPPGLFSFPTAGATHVATQLTPIGAVIASPLFVAISGDNAFVGDIENGLVYSVVFTATTYDATLIQSFGGGGVGGLAISTDGFLYISEAFNNQICRVPLSNPSGPVTVVAVLVMPTDGLAVSNDGQTVFFTFAFSRSGIYSFPTNGPFPATITPLLELAIQQGIDIAIQPISVLPPASLSGSQQKNDFGLLFERVNFLQWNPSPSNNVAGYDVYRNGNLIASVDASTFSYQDHDIEPGVAIGYSVAAVDAMGNESSQVNVTIN